MTAFFLTCVAVGVVVLTLQIVLNLVGLGASGLLDVEVPEDLEAPDFELPELEAPELEVPELEVPEIDAPEDFALDVASHDGHVGVAETEAGLNLFSVRALSAGVAAYGATGLAFVAWMPSWVAAVLAVVPAYAVATGTAWLIRQMLRMQTSGTLRLQGAVGREATVYLTVPAARSGDEYGLIHLVLQGRTVELRAVTREAEALPSGSDVVVLSVSEDGETAEVVRASTFEDMIHEH